MDFNMEHETGHEDITREYLIRILNHLIVQMHTTIKKMNKITIRLNEIESEDKLFGETTSQLMEFIEDTLQKDS